MVSLIISMCLGPADANLEINMQDQSAPSLPLEPRLLC
jgi:hypothetical protein